MNAFEISQQQNIQLARQVYDAFAEKDISSVLDVLADDIDWLFFGPAEIPFAGHYRGRDQVAQFFEKALEHSEFLTFEPREFLAGATSVLVQGDEEVRAKTTGRIWTTEWAHVFTVRDGKIVKMREYYDTAVMVAAFCD